MSIRTREFPTFILWEIVVESGSWLLCPSLLILGLSFSATCRDFVRFIQSLLTSGRSSSPVSQSDTEFDLLSPTTISRIGSEPLFLTAEGVLRPGNTLSLSSKLSTPNFTNDPGVLWKLDLPFLALLLPRDGWYGRPASDSVSSSWVTLVGCCQVFAHQLEVSYPPNFQNLEVHPWWQ